MAELICLIVFAISIVVLGINLSVWICNHNKLESKVKLLAETNRFLLYKVDRLERVNRIARCITEVERTNIKTTTR